MTLHPLKHITSSEGLGLATTKTMRCISEAVSIGTKVWNEISEPWREGDTIIAEPGYSWVTKWEVGVPYIVTKFLDTNSQLVGVYCDISRPVEKTGDGFSFTDIYLDVWQPAGENPAILDEAELIEAVGAGYISPDEADDARKTAASLVARLTNDPDFLNF